ncbi:hypothetical protein LCGC14_1935520, partial [marine sediment metagenome]
TLGGEGRGYLSFPMRGHTLALDFPAKPGVSELLQKLERITLDHGGRIYLAKDSVMSAESFAAMYPKVDAMRAVHRRFKGKPGTLAQYGDSITITGAFLAHYAFARKIEPKNCPADVKRECEVVQKHADLDLWRKWKGIGNTGMTTNDWLFRGVDGWQKRLNPEAAVIMFGTNDGMPAPQYAENTASALRRILANGTVPILTSPPPKRNSNKEPYRLACLAIANGLKVPLIDFYTEILRRRPDDWDGQLPQFKKYKGYQQPTLMHDAHPSNPSQWVNDFSEEGLNKNGYNLRNYMTIRAYYQVITKAFEAGG